MKKKLASRRIRFFLVLSWAIIVALAASRVPRAAATLHSAAGVGSNPLKTIALAAPKNLKAAWIGEDVVLSWSAGGNGDAYAVLGSVSQTSNCNKVDWTLIGEVAGPAVTTFVDTKRTIPKGRWYCYMVQTVDAGWTSTGNPTTAVRDNVNMKLVELSSTLTPVALIQVVRQTPTATGPTKAAIQGGAPAPLTLTATWTRGTTINPMQVATARSTVTLTPISEPVRTEVPTAPASRTTAGAKEALTPTVTLTRTRAAMPTTTETMTPTTPASARPVSPTTTTTDVALTKVSTSVIPTAAEPPSR